MDPMRWHYRFNVAVGALALDGVVRAGRGHERERDAADGKHALVHAGSPAVALVAGARACAHVAQARLHRGRGLLLASSSQLQITETRT